MQHFSQKWLPNPTAIMPFYLKGYVKIENKSSHVGYPNKKVSIGHIFLAQLLVKTVQK